MLSSIQPFLRTTELEKTIKKVAGWKKSSMKRETEEGRK
jgi:hypothetical protein